MMSLFITIGGGSVHGAAGGALLHCSLLPHGQEERLSRCFSHILHRRIHEVSQEDWNHYMWVVGGAFLLTPSLLVMVVRLFSTRG